MAPPNYRITGRQLPIGLAGLFLLWPLGLAAATAQTVAQQPAPESMQRYIAGSYEQVHKLALTLEQITDEQCSAALGSTKAAASAQQALQSAFQVLALSWSRVAFIRIGAYRENLAGQRMQFWPDKRGSGERQIQQALMAKPTTLLQPASLQQQSVALQGLPAYEAVLMEMIEPLEGRATAVDADFRCDYLTTIADSLADISGQLAEGMALGSEAPGAITFAQWMEVIRGGLQITGEMKLRAIGQSMGSLLAQSASGNDTLSLELTRKVPFSRSHLVIASVRAELDGIAALLASTEIEGLLQSNDAGYLASVRFQLTQAAKAVESLESLEGRAVTAAELKEAIGVVDYASGMLAQSGSDMLTTLYPALGLSRGFNSMDGD